MLPVAHGLSFLSLLGLQGCDSTTTVEPPESPLIALTPTEYNNTVRDLLGMPDDGDDWPAAPEIASRFTAYEGEQAGLFGIDPIEEPPWPWTLPEEAGLDGFQGMFEGQEPSAYQLEELQKAAVHFASYTLASSIFFTCDDWSAEQSKDCGWESVARFTQRAWRRPMEQAERKRLEAFWDANWNEGTPEEAVVLTLAGVLQSPQFIFRVERGDLEAADGTCIPLTDWEIATRLSYFLWDSMPDAPLFEAAASGDLSSTEGIRTQVQRMLQDPKAHDAVVQFHHQWLGTDEIQAISPDRSAYGPLYGLDPDPELDTTGDEDWPAVLGPVRHSMDAEVHLFVRDVVFDGEGTLQSLFTEARGWMSSYTAPLYGDVERLDGATEKWSYGNVQASLGVEGQLTLFPVAFPAGQRAGLLTLPAVLAVGAYTIHPAPILRGRTVLERVTCTDLGTPPQGADAAAPPDSLDAESTNRERTEVATSPAECIGCHEILNPPGFAFEHYDAMGVWRDQDNGQDVDASGSFTVQGETFSFEDGLALGEQLGRSEGVRDCYSLHWARYATGEHLDPDDERLREFQDSFRSRDDIQSLLEGIAVSPLFRNLWLEELSP